ncbi:hypothetical protein HZA99_00735 [Candidatus Woesearchaeota archaeon]|nr:hypothetical protein [Candidatus Woesearchaeota archaeon]
MGLVGIILCSAALAEDAVPEKSSPFSFSAGVGYRVISLESSITQYVRQTNTVDGLEVSDSLTNTSFTLPYFVLRAGFEPHRYIPLIPDALRFSVDVEWTSSAIFGESTNNENMAVSYNGIDFGDAKTKWSHYLQDYFSYGVDVFYCTHPLHLWFIEIRPGFGVSGNISQVSNTSEINMHLAKSKILDAVSEQALEEQYGVYTNTTTYATISGDGYSVYPYASVGVRLWNVYLVSNFGYRSEHIPLTISQKTVSSDGVDLGSESTSLELDASGFSASIVLEIPLDGKNIPLLSWFHPSFDPAVRRAVKHFADQQNRN